jgi:hypothetical protein
MNSVLLLLSYSQAHHGAALSCSCERFGRILQLLNVLCAALLCTIAVLRARGCVLHDYHITADNEVHADAVSALAQLSIQH